MSSLSRLRRQRRLGFEFTTITLLGHCRCNFGPLSYHILMNSKEHSMNQRLRYVLIATTAALFAAGGASAADPVTTWNMIAIQASLMAGENAGVQSRALAIVQVAIHDALNSIDARYERYAFKA